jgi:hypothetical protein
MGFVLACFEGYSRNFCVSIVEKYQLVKDFLTEKPTTRRVANRGM